MANNSSGSTTQLLSVVGDRNAINVQHEWSALLKPQLSMQKVTMPTTRRSFGQSAAPE
ncbi:hypothetical protein ACQ4M4_19525 [Leptolyngbya sp. AN02str]|uniref:hypothetical protein n=1 Tax=Leptolyngbya sp. AN02str TaxID=3423363 RepID=UPI003D310595